MAWNMVSYLSVVRLLSMKKDPITILSIIFVLHRLSENTVYAFH